MLLSELLRHPNWSGLITLPITNETYPLKLSHDSQQVLFTHKNATYFVADQPVEIEADGRFSMRVKPKNRMLRNLPGQLAAYLLDHQHNRINPFKVKKRIIYHSAA